MAEAYDERKSNHRLALGEAVVSSLHELGLEPAKDLRLYEEKGKPTLYRIRVFGDKDADTGIDLVVKVPLSQTGRMKKGHDIWVRTIYVPQHGQYHRPKKIGPEWIVVRGPDITIDGIVMDMADAVRATWDKAFERRRCRHCGAPLFRSRTGKQVCSDICWEMPQLRTPDRLARLGIQPAPYGTGLGDWTPPPKIRTVQECRDEFKVLMVKAVTTIGITPAEFNAVVDKHRQGNSPEDYCRAARLAEAELVPPDLTDIEHTIVDLFLD